MSVDSESRESTEELSRVAVALITERAAREYGRTPLVEVLGGHSLWSEFRRTYSEHLGVWEDFSSVTLVVSTAGTLAGWLVDHRLAASGESTLNDAEVGRIAGTAAELPPGVRMVRVRREPPDAERSVAVATFAGSSESDQYDVFVNHTSGVVIGCLPLAVDPVSEVARDDAAAKAAVELAWQRIEGELGERAGPAAAAQSRQVLRLVPVSAARDQRGRTTRVFRLWRYLSTADVSIDIDSHTVCNWYIDAWQREDPRQGLAPLDPVELARPELTAESGAQGPRVSTERQGETEITTVYWWHAEDGVNVEGDQTTVQINVGTGRVFAVSRKWRRIAGELLRSATVSAADALSAAQRMIGAASDLGVGTVLGQNIIQLSPSAEEPGPVTDALVWRVGFAAVDGVRFTEASVDCHTGEVVRVTGW